MRKYYFILIIILFAFFASLQSAKASHLGGGFFQWECLGGNQYSIKLTLYRDCSPSSAAAPNNATFTFTNTCGLTNPTASASRVLSGTLTPALYCPGFLSQCDGGSLTSYQIWTYTAVVTLPPCSLWNLSYTVNNRNVTIVNGGANQSFYIHAGINTAAGCDTSPAITQPPVSLCVGQQLGYNLGALDANGDSLTYELVPAQINATTSVTYNAPYTGTSPGPSTVFDSTTGQLSFVPNVAGPWVFVFRVNSYNSAGVFTGYIILDFQFIAVSCSNEAPTSPSNQIINYTGGGNVTGPNSIAICRGDSFSLSYVFTDSLNPVTPNGPSPGLSAQTITVTTNAGIVMPGAVLTQTGTNPATATISWVAPSNAAGNRTFILQAKDSNCPTPGSFTASINVQIVYSTIATGDTLICPGESVSIEAINGANFTWTAISGDPISVGTNFSCNPCATPVATPLVTTQYQVVSNLGAGCVNTDTVEVQVHPDITVVASPDTLLCNNSSTFSLQAQVTPAGAYTYDWGAGFGLTSPSSATPTVSPTITHDYIVTVTTPIGCSRTDTATVQVFSPPTLTVSNDTAICIGLSAQLIASGTGTYNWSPASTLNATNIATPIASPTSATKYYVTLTANTCTSEDSIEVSVNPLPIINIGNDTALCKPNTVTFYAPVSNTTLWSNGSTADSLVVSNAGTYIATISDNNNCFASDTVVVNFFGQPQLTPASLSYCIGDTGNVTAAGAQTYLWYPAANLSATTGASITVYSQVSTTYFVQGIDSNGCIDTTTLSVTVNPLPAVDAGATQLICPGTSTTLAGTGAQTYMWNNGITDGNSFTPTASTLYTVTGTDANNCEATDTVTVNISPIVNASITVDQNVFCFGSNEGMLTANGTGGFGAYTYLWSNNATTQPISGLTAGNYYVVITDTRNCFDSAFATVTEPTALVVSASLINNVYCFGGNNGAALATSMGGSGTVSYAWQTSPIVVNDTVNTLTVGSFNVIATDSLGCLDTASISISQPTAISIALTSSENINCFGDSTGSIVTATTGGSGPYTFSWSPISSVNDSLLQIPAGTYTAIVSDSLNCKDTLVTTLTEPTALDLQTTVLSNVNCFGDSTAQGAAQAFGGTAPYEYSWSTGDTITLVQNLVAGTFTVSVTDTLGCSDTASITITQPQAALSISTLNITQVACFGDSSASITIAGAGGTAPYSYNWSTGTTDSTLANIPVGTYTVTVTDNLNCTDTLSFTITSPTALTLSADSVRNISCFGLNDGYASAVAGGGVTPYSYAWSSGSGLPTAINLIADTYTVVVTDSNGCTIQLDTILTEPTLLDISAYASLYVTCFGYSDGLLGSSASGGTLPYQYIWSTGDTTASASNVPAGTYTLTVTDGHGCTDTSSAIITQPAAVAASTSLINNVSCFGGSDGNGLAEAIGGTGTISFQWQTTPAQNDDTLLNVSIGTYTVVATDVNNCTDTAFLTISEPTQLLGSISTQTNVFCYGDSTASTTITPTGGTPPYAFAWSYGGITDSTITNLPAATYTVTVTDSLNCFFSISTNVTQPSAPLSLGLDSGVNISCFGFSDGLIRVASTGGTSPYMYSWSGMATSGNDSLATALVAGSYTFTVTDTLGCVDTLTLALTQPSPLFVIPSPIVDVACFGDSTATATATPSGGTAPFSYQWSANTGSQTTQTAIGLGANTYNVTVTDNNGCIKDTFAVVIQPSAPLSIAIDSITNVDCFGNNSGAIYSSAAGGTTPYQFSWTLGVSTTDTALNLIAGTYFIQVNDSNNCFDTITTVITEPTPLQLANSTQTDVFCHGDSTGNASVSATGGTLPYLYYWTLTPITFNTDSAYNLPFGDYFAHVVDSNTCHDSLLVNILQPNQPLSITIQNIQHVSCFGGSDGNIQIVVNGGTAPYTYTWPAGISASGVNATGLAEGQYTVTVTDTLGCTDSLQIIITQPTVLSVQITNTSAASCFGFANGFSSSLATGGTLPYTYQWGANTGFQTGATASQLFADTFAVTVTDAKGCIDSATTIITQPDSALLITQTNAGDVSCFGYNDGWVKIEAAGGTASYNYAWDSSVGAQIGDSAFNLFAGNYVITVTDHNGCVDSLLITINQPPLLEATVTSVTPVNCNSGNDGEATVSITGGTAGYTYLWNTNTGQQTTATANNLAYGTYIATITDALGCTDTAKAIVNQPPTPLAPQLNSSTNITCYNGNNGTIGVGATGGTTPYTYLWDANALSSTQPVVANLIAGTYWVTITDANGCFDSLATTLTEPTELQLSILSQNNVLCFGGNSGNATVSATGGVPNYSYQWSALAGSQITATASFLTAGSYVVTVTDAHLCIDTIHVTITQATNPITSNTSTKSDVTCFGANDGQINCNVVGGTPPYSYIWSSNAPNALGNSANNLGPGNYSVTITDSLGCTNIRSFTIFEPSQLNYAMTTPDSICPGTSLQVGIGVVGGVQPYTFNWNNGLPNSSSHIVSPAVSTTYNVTLTDANGCGNFVGSVHIGVKNLDYNDASMLFTPSICRGDSTVVGVNYSGPGAVNYNWNTGAITPGPFVVKPPNTTIYVVSITDQCGNLLVLSDTVDVRPTPSAYFPPFSGEGCPPLEIYFYDSAVAASGYVYQWEFGDGGIAIDTTPTHIFNTSGFYNIKVTVVSPNGCSTVYPTFTSVNVYPVPQVSFDVDPPTAYRDNGTIDFINTTIDGKYYVWLLDTIDTLYTTDITHRFNEVGVFSATLIAQSAQGCIDSTTNYVEILPTYEVIIPNAFTPNPLGSNGGLYTDYDLNNDVFRPHTDGVVSYHMMIFNRWGELVFESFDYKVGWDGYREGKLVSPDTYVYKIKIGWGNGTQTEKVGDVILLR